MLALAAFLLVAAAPPAAYVDTGTARVPLGITSWCWDTRCGAPLGHTGQRVLVKRGSAVRVELPFEPLEATINVAGAASKPTTRAREVTWTATRAGGLTVYVKYRRGWVIYSARLALR
ncbi:MAG: hypothetical protein QOH16_3673 [Gaiellaceae bacterium]|nr:hypothetical protein [Gaiellaceae bacterium]